MPIADADRSTTPEVDLPVTWKFPCKSNGNAWEEQRHQCPMQKFRDW